MHKTNSSRQHPHGKASPKLLLLIGGGGCALLIVLAVVGVLAFGAIGAAVSGDEEGSLPPRVKYPVPEATVAESIKTACSGQHLCGYTREEVPWEIADYTVTNAFEGSIDGDYGWVIEATARVVGKFDDRPDKYRIPAEVRVPVTVVCQQFGNRWEFGNCLWDDKATAAYVVCDATGAPAPGAGPVPQQLVDAAVRKMAGYHVAFACRGDGTFDEWEVTDCKITAHKEVTQDGCPAHQLDFEARCRRSPEAAAVAFGWPPMARLTGRFVAVQRGRRWEVPDNVTDGGQIEAGEVTVIPILALIDCSSTEDQALIAAAETAAGVVLARYAESAREVYSTWEVSPAKIVGGERKTAAGLPLVGVKFTSEFSGVPDPEKPAFAARPTKGRLRGELCLLSHGNRLEVLDNARYGPFEYAWEITEEPIGDDGAPAE